MWVSPFRHFFPRSCQPWKSAGGLSLQHGVRGLQARVHAPHSRAHSRRSVLMKFVRLRRQRTHVLARFVNESECDSNVRSRFRRVQTEENSKGFSTDWNARPGTRNPPSLMLAKGIFADAALFDRPTDRRETARISPPRSPGLERSRQTEPRSLQPAISRRSSSPG